MVNQKKEGIKATPHLETERLILRRFTLEDAEAMYENWANDDEVTKSISWHTHQNIDVTRSVLGKSLSR